MYFVNLVCLLEKGYSHSICTNMTNGAVVCQDMIDNVQKIVTNLEIWDSILPILPTTIFCLFLGVWSDANGRKPVFLAAFIAGLAMSLVYAINYTFFHELNVYHLLWVGALGLSTGKVIIKIALFGYIGN